MMIVHNFQVRAYGWQELAMLYAPGLQPESASKRLSKWVIGNQSLTDSLRAHGWRKGTRMLKPVQVADIIEVFGEP